MGMSINSSGEYVILFGIYYFCSFRFHAGCKDRRNFPVFDGNVTIRHGISSDNFPVFYKYIIHNSRFPHMFHFVST